MYLALLIIVGFVPWAIGMLTFWHWARPQKAPADESNRINAIRLWWFALTREDKFVDTFPWLKNDEWNNVIKK